MSSFDSTDGDDATIVGFWVRVRVNLRRRQFSGVLDQRRRASCSQVSAGRRPPRPRSQTSASRRIQGTLRSSDLCSCRPAVAVAAWSATRQDACRRSQCRRRVGSFSGRPPLLDVLHPYWRFPRYIACNTSCRRLDDAMQRVMQHGPRSGVNIMVEAPPIDPIARAKAEETFFRAGAVFSSELNKILG